MNAVRTLLAVTALFIAARSAVAGDRCCPDCGKKTCQPTWEEKTKKRHCYEVTCKDICIPKFRWPWEMCCDPKCDAAMAKLLKYNKKRHDYFVIPKEPQETKVKPRPEAAEKRARKSLKRQRFLKALPRDATTRANDERYSGIT